MQPLSGNTKDCSELGHVVRAHGPQLCTAPRITYLVADSALYSADNLQTLPKSGVPWLPRVPATLTEARAVLAPLDPPTRAPVIESYRFQEVPAT